MTSENGPMEKNLPYLQRKMYIKDIDRWCTKWLVRINAKIIFTRKKSLSHNNITLYNSTLKLVIEVKFLGVTFNMYNLHRIHTSITLKLLIL